MSNLDYIYNWIENNLTKILQIYIKERCEKGDGLLFIVGKKKEVKIDIYFNSFENINVDLVTKVKELNYTKSKAYFLCFDSENPNENSLIQKELVENINN
tara:strand:- start:1618 stop:1917 length:300 start_codon:yes stop_codon:yes gene_type:complete